MAYGWEYQNIHEGVWALGARDYRSLAESDAVWVLHVHLIYGLSSRGATVPRLIISDAIPSRLRGDLTVNLLVSHAPAGCLVWATNKARSFIRPTTEYFASQRGLANLRLSQALHGAPMLWSFAWSEGTY